MGLEDFQKTHGQEWSEIVRSSSFGSALSLATAEKLEEVRELSDEDIILKGPVILSDLRGHLRYETALLGLHETKPSVFSDPITEEYPNPEKEAFEQELIEQGRSPEEAAARFQIAPTPISKPKKKPAPRKKKK